MNPEYGALLDRLRSLDLTGRAFRGACMDALSQIPGYDWCGIYAMEAPIEPGDTSVGLVLDAYVGAPTDHTRISVGQGVCGMAVAEARNQVVDDVTNLDNYLSCSAATKAEIVVLVWTTDRAKILGQIDVDSHSAGRFGPEDENLLIELAELISQRWLD